MDCAAQCFKVDTVVNQKYVQRGRSTILHNCPISDVRDGTSVTRRPRWDVQDGTYVLLRTSNLRHLIWDDVPNFGHPRSDIPSQTFMSNCTSARSKVCMADSNTL